MQHKEVLEHVSRVFDADVLPSISDYIRIPNKSPIFDTNWEQAGHMMRATELVASWCRGRKIEGLDVRIVKHSGRTPLILATVPARGTSTDAPVLIYGHLDKQPEMSGWSDGLSPFVPVHRGDRLYGRGGADDGYSAFSALLAIEALERFGSARPRTVVVIEASEESGSHDLPHYVDALAEDIGRPQLIVCLDSGCGDYERLWCTTSLRGIVVGDLDVRVLTEGVHSGDAGGIVPSTFRIARQLLSRIERETTGEILLESAKVSIPEARRAEAAVVAKVLGEDVFAKFPFAKGVRPSLEDHTELVLNRTWRSALEVTGADGLPKVADAGNVARPSTVLRLSLRLPPTADPDRALAELKATLKREPPHGAVVSFDGEGARGWDAPATKPWLHRALELSSEAYFGRPLAQNGEGGSIPFMAMLGERFPEAQFVITGVLGPQSNAHGPNEFLHIPTAKKITASVATVLAECAAQSLHA